MSTIFAIFIFYTMIGSIISPESDNKDGKIDGTVQSTHEHSSISTHEHSSTHSSGSLPPTTVKNEHSGDHGHPVTSDPHHQVPNPLHDQPPVNPIVSNYPLMNWLKQHTTYAEPIIEIQKASDEFFKNLHNLLLEQAHKNFPNVEAFKTNNHDDTGSKLKESFGKLLHSVKGLAEHNMNKNFGRSKAAYSALKEDPNDEHRQKEMRKALAGDISSNIRGMFPDPVSAGKKLLQRIGWMEGDKEHETKDGHQHQDGKSGNQHGQDHDGVKDGHAKDHSEHGEIHSERKIEKKHSGNDIHGYGEEIHTKGKQIDRTNSDHHQSRQSAADSFVENLVEGFMNIFPIHKLFT